MFAVIFKATIQTLDEEYSLYANKLRDLAMSKYGCTDFVSSCEGNQEVAISYWASEQDIARWHNDPLHKRAQQLGKEKWYQNYTVEVVEVKKELLKMNVSYREMQVADYDAVMALWQETEHMLIREADSRENVTSYLDQNPNMSFVAIVHGKIVGAVLAGTDGRRGYLQHLAVGADYRGKRIGKTLVEKVTDAFAHIGISKTHLFVNTENEQAQMFYKSMGWELRQEVKMYSFNSTANLDI